MIKLLITLLFFYSTWSLGYSLKETKILAEKGDSKAQLELAKQYIILSKPEEGMKWLMSSAHQNNNEALVMLAKQYETGLLIKKNTKMAQDLYLKAAENGNLDGQYSLAKTYLNGLGVLQDYTMALAWLIEASLSGKENIIAERDALQKLMSPNQLTKAHEISKAIHARVTNQKQKK